MRINCKVQKKSKNARLVWYEYPRRKKSEQEGFLQNFKKKNIHQLRLYILERNKKQKYTCGIYI